MLKLRKLAFIKAMFKSEVSTVFLRELMEGCGSSQEEEGFRGPKCQRCERFGPRA
jgi:hypothetical protein